jgi:tetratricopeptide (TPR) repeat protein
MSSGLGGGRLVPLRTAWFTTSRRGACWILLALLLLLPGAAGSEPAVPEPASRRLVLLRTELPQALESLRPGISFWLYHHLDSAGVELLRPPPNAGSELEPRRQLWTRLAREAGATHLLTSDLALELGSVTLQLVCVDGATGEVVAAAEASQPLPEIGGALRQATRGLLGQLALPGDSLAGKQAPRVAQVAGWSRAIAHLQARRLARAHLELVGDPSPVARALRARVRDAGRGQTQSVAKAARLSVAEGKLDRAWLRIRSALRTQDDPELFLAAGEVAEARANPEQALAFYDKAMRGDPESGEAVLGRGRALSETGRAEEARVAFERAQQLLPDDPRPPEALARDSALPAERRAALFRSAGERAARRLELERAARHLEQAASLDPGQAGSAHQALGHVQQLQGRRAAAGHSYENAVSMGEEDPLTWTTLGRIRRSLEDVLGAEQAFEEALARDDGLMEAHLELGELLAETERLDVALPHLERAVRLAPADARARRALARALQASGDSQAALALLAKPVATRADEVGRLHAVALIRAKAGELEPAQQALEAAIALAPERAVLRRELASLHDARGDDAAARAALAEASALSASGAAGVDSDELAGKPLSGSFAALVESFPDLGRVLLLGLELDRAWPERLRDAVSPRTLDVGALERELARTLARRFRFEANPPEVPELERDRRALQAFSTEPERIALVNDVLGVDASFVGRVSLSLPPSDEEGPPILTVALRLLRGRRAAEVEILANDTTLPLELEHYQHWNPIAFGLYGMLVTLLGLRFRRGWGSLHVTLDYAHVGKGFFSIKLSKRPGKARKGKKKTGGHANPFQRRLRSLGRFERYMAGRESVFRWLPARTYYVAVHGLLQDPLTDEVVGNYFEEKTASVQRGKRLELPFDFRPREAPVEVRVWAGDQPASQALVAVRGRPDTLKYARGGRLVIPLGPGPHAIRVGIGGSVLEKGIEIRELEGATLHFSVSDEGSIVFEDCEQAVGPYLDGDDLAAADVLEAAGLVDVGNRMRGRYHELRGEAGEAARYFEAAGCLEQAAELVQGTESERSAALFEQAGDLSRAAESYRAAGDPLRAAKAFEDSYEWDRAIECYREAGESAKLLVLLEKVGEYFEAGELALELGEVDRAIAALQQVDLRDRRYPRSCERLAEILEGQGEFELAARKLGDAVDASGGDAAPVSLLARLAFLLERADRLEQALEAYETVRQRDLAQAGVADKIQELRERLRKANETEPPAVATQAPQGESRYELLGEIGRGGMGVVFKARDRRLDRVVALKRLPENLRNHPTAVKLFLREARAVAALNHPNIVTLFDADQEQDAYFITMEYLEGLPLNALLAKHGKLAAKDVARLGAQVAGGLHYAHERRIVHRDVKTANLFFTRARVVKIMDFGLAKMLEEVRRGSTVIGGTPFYMAPEQACGDAVDHRADLYAFGVTLFELLVGQVPFREGDVAYHHRHTAPPDPREAGLEVPDGLAELILGLLRKSPEERPESAARVGRELQRIASNL